MILGSLTSLAPLGIAFSVMPSAKRPEAILIVNPSAGRSPDRVREDVLEILRTRFRLDAYSTTARDSGITIARDAADAGARIVIAYGGDGHVNEVANGLACTESRLAIVPGGTMNVFARTLGLPLDPVAAIDRILDGLDRSPRRVPLGRMDERYFTFSAGCGFDAEAAERVERYVPAKRRFGEMFFYWSAFRILAGSYRHRNPTMTLSGSFGTIPVSMAIASNAGPYAYLAGRPVTLTPDVSLDGGLDVFALKTMRIEALPFYAYRVILGGLADHGDAFYGHDLDAFDVMSETPFKRHVDGEPIAPSRYARFRLIRDALMVVA